MDSSQKLRRQLGLLDVFAISTGAMFSSGFFLLPGLAAAQSGPSVFIAYLLASIVMIFPMLSMAELSTALPRAGGAYFILDRSLGHIAGSIAGLGNWIVLILKSSFALVGMGAYLSIIVDVPIQPLALVFVLIFGLANLMGAKHSTFLQKLLVLYLFIMMVLFVAQGSVEVATAGFQNIFEGQFRPFLPFGVSGLLATVGMVFVSYTGLTKVASVAGEIKNPDKNIPLGMAISLLVTTLIYVVGVFIIVALLEPNELRGDLRPVATAASVFMDWLPNSLGVVLIVIAAVAAFASTANAGVLSASRYPLAMGRDHILPPYFQKLNQFRIPQNAIIITSLLIAIIVLFVDISEIAKLASAFQLLLFALINIAVIVIRMSKIEGYKPGFVTPFYPWIQIIGIATTLFLIWQIGLLELIFSTILILLSIIWFYLYAQKRTSPQGAIYKLFKHSDEKYILKLKRELRVRIKLREAFKSDNFPTIIKNSSVTDIKSQRHQKIPLNQIHSVVSETLKKEQIIPPYIKKVIGKGTELDFLTFPNGIVVIDILYLSTKKQIDETTTLHLIRLPDDYSFDLLDLYQTDINHRVKNGIVVLSSSKRARLKHLRILSQIVKPMDKENFIPKWRHAPNPNALRNLFL
ncbi:APC family permease [Chitinispirillales bacterium ANBcel5]|uniref:amino acid permease n=1 Tax=Cellulosispirillum alkaliphilum TaxID=3039283 RepID=UPI002A5951BD|nr:APC family permease [Chitinispirillales bacterium ANBcel5]